MLSSVEAVRILSEIEKGIKDPLLIEYFRITDVNFNESSFGTNLYAKWSELNFCFEVLKKEMALAKCLKNRNFKLDE